MNRCIPAAALILAMTASGALAAPTQLYGKSVVVSWTENRMQTTDVSSVPTPMTASGQLSIYVSDKGRTFSRISMVVSGRRRTNSGQLDRAPGEASARSISFHANSMRAAAPVGNAGARLVSVTFDSGFQGCSAHVVTGKTPGASGTTVHSFVTGRQYTFFSVQTSGESCSVQSGNVFGN